MPKLRSLPPMLRQADTRTAKPLPSPPRFKIKNPIYDSPEFRQWRAIVVARANGQCEAIVNGVRCSKSAPQHRMYADHIIELRDGGSLTDPNNGQCLCRSHHELKTVAMRKQRLANPILPRQF